MRNTTLAILLSGLVVATCLIAYLADNLGKNLGKKRISIFGLRPRQTATLISMASSVAVMLLTVVILMTTNKSINNALLHYDEKVRAANRERERAEKYAQQLKREAASKQKLIADSNRRLSSLQGALRTTSTQLTSIRARLTEVQHSRANAERAKNAAVRSATQARRSAQIALVRYRQAERGFKVLRVQLGAARVQYRNARQRLQSEQKRVNTVNQRLAQLENSLSSTRSETQEARQELTQAHTALAQAQASFNTADRELKTTLSQYQDAKSQLADKQVQSVKLQEELDSKQEELIRKQEEYNQLEKKAAQLRAATQYFNAVSTLISIGKVSVAQGTVFGDITIAPRTPASDIRANLENLLSVGRGALAKDGSTLELAPLPISLGGKNNDQVVSLVGEEIITQLALHLSTADSPVSVRLVAVRDYAVGETEIFARFLTVPVRTVFKEGDALAEKTISNSANDARIFNQLLALLNEGEAVARSKGMAPLLTTRNPYFFATGTNERIFEALRRIQGQSALTKVQLVAAQDLSTVEPLRVRFEISTGNSTSEGNASRSDDTGARSRQG